MISCKIVNQCQGRALLMRKHSSIVISQACRSLLSHANHCTWGKATTLSPGLLSVKLSLLAYKFPYVLKRYPCVSYPLWWLYIHTSRELNTPAMPLINQQQTEDLAKYSTTRDDRPLISCYLRTRQSIVLLADKNPSYPLSELSFNCLSHYACQPKTRYKMIAAIVIGF